jgi:predicted aspartyl protease
VIAGYVDEYRQAIVELTIVGPFGRKEHLEFIVDTGFGGGLTLHSSIAAELQLKAVGVGRAILADGHETVFDLCEAFVVWGNELRPVLVGLADTVALMGMALLEGNVLRLEAVAGGDVRITPLSASPLQLEA